MDVERIKEEREAVDRERKERGEDGLEQTCTQVLGLLVL